MLKVSLNKLEDNSYCMLKKKCMIQCEFCDATFSNRYASIIHNAYHIVIPLIKQEFHQCSECLFHFSSLSKLDDHCRHKHHNNKYEIIDLETLEDEPSSERDMFLPYFKIDTNNMYGSIDERKFETEEYILPDVCNADRVGSLLKVRETKEKHKVKETLSIHYDQLVQPGIYKCKYCNQQFVNKFKSIEHETTHMRFKKGRPLLCTICDMYIAGNHWQLTKHVAEKHPLRTDRPRIKTLCNICGLKYHKYIRHIRNYHQDLAANLNSNGTDNDGGIKGNEVSNVNVNVNVTCVNRTKESVFNVCQGCLPFLKKNIGLKYMIIGSVNQIGKRHKCDKCKRMFFEITLMKRMVVSRKAIDKLHFEEEAPKRKALSNEDRLKNIQMRLKMINKLSKF